MKSFQITPAKNESGNVYILASEVGFNDLGIGTRKSGFILVAPEKAEEVLEKLNSGELTAKFSKTKNARDLYDVEVAVATEVEQHA